jgi:hypothetical protein
VLLLCVDPKPTPVIVTVAPAGPVLGEMPVTDSDWRTVNCTPLLTTPASVTLTGPLVAEDGTEAVMLVSLQDGEAAATPLKETLNPVLWLAPKPLPAIVIVPPGPAAGGVKLVIVGL